MESDLLRVLTDKAADDELPMGAGQPEIAPALPARGSRVFVVAGIVAAVVLAFDASLFLVHHNRAARPVVAAAPAAADPMPHYMLVPLAAPPAVAPTPAPTPTPVTTPVVATAIPDAPRIAVKEHRHSHHHHASH